LTDETPEKVRRNGSIAAEHVELGRAHASPVGEITGDRRFAIFHRGRDLGENHIAIAEMGKPL
jgi:hypothetical protein